MNRTKWSSSLAMALVSLAAATAHSADPGFYAIASLGQGSEDPQSNGTNFANSQVVVHVDPDRVTVDDGDLAWGVGLGYRINRYLAGEIEYVDFGTTDIDEHYSVPNAGPIPFPSVVDLQFSSKMTGPLLSVLGTMPVGEDFEIFVRGGALFASREYRVVSAFSFARDQKFADTVWLAGAGVNWSFAKRWGVRVEYQQTGKFDKTLASGETDLNRISLSALYRF